MHTRQRMSGCATLLLRYNTKSPLIIVQCAFEANNPVSNRDVTKCLVVRTRAPAQQGVLERFTLRAVLRS